MFWKRFENAIKISSTPAETIALLVPHNPRDKLFPEVFDLGEEKVNVSFLHNWDKNSLVAIQGLPNERTSVNLAALADVAGNTSRPDILVKMQNLIHDLHTLLFYVSSRLSISES